MATVHISYEKEKEIAQELTALEERDYLYVGHDKTSVTVTFQSSFLNQLVKIARGEQASPLAQRIYDELKLSREIVISLLEQEIQNYAPGAVFPNPRMVEHLNSLIASL